jgi:hypothetical protein
VDGAEQDERPERAHDRCEVAHGPILGRAHWHGVSVPSGFGYGASWNDIGMTEQQPEVDDRHDSIVVEGDDREHVLPPQELDPFTPEPAPPRKARAAMVAALVLVAVLLAIVVIYAVAR